MRKVRANVTSADESSRGQLSRESLRRLGERLSATPEPVPVYSTKSGALCGSASGFEVEGDDLWATLTVEDSTPDFARAVGVLAFLDEGPKLVCVMVSNLSREAFRGMAEPVARAIESNMIGGPIRVDRAHYMRTLEAVMKAMIEWDAKRSDRSSSIVLREPPGDTALVMSLRAAIPFLAGNAAAREMLEFIDERTAGEATAMMVFAVVNQGQEAARFLRTVGPLGSA